MAEPDIIRFGEELRDHLAACMDLVLVLERSAGDRNARSDLARRLHSIKGTARMMGFEELADTAHALEDVVSALPSPMEEGMPREVVDVLLASLDTIQDHVDALVRATPPPSLDSVLAHLSSVSTLLKDEEWPDLGRVQQILPWLPRVLLRSQIDIFLKRRSAYPTACVVELRAPRDDFRSRVLAWRSQLGAQGEVVALAARDAEPDILFAFLVLSRASAADLARELPEAQVSELDGSREDLRDAPSNISMNQDISDEFRRLQLWFLEESQEQMTRLGGLIVSLEQNPSPDTVDEVFRTFHNLKGSGASFGYAAISRIAHVCESYFQPYRVDPRTVTARVVDGLLACLDALEMVCRRTAESGDEEVPIDDIEGPLLRALQNHESIVTARTPPPPSRRTGTWSGSIRVDVGAVDRVVRAAAEIAVAGHDDERLLSQLESMRRDLQDARRSWNTMKERLLGVTLPQELHEVTQRIDARLARTEQDLDDLRTREERTVQRRSALTSSLTRDMTNLAMQPVSSLLEGMERVVRDTARAVQKRIRFQVEDSGVRADRGVLDALRDPLVHILRNAVDHGIESPERRRQLGKEEEGTIEIHLLEKGARFEVCVRDDGKGIDRDAIRRRLIERGSRTKEEADRLSDSELLATIFLPGFSTRDTVSSTSGRGVGMDVVATAIRDLGGDIQISSLPDEGMEIRLQVPMLSSLTHVLTIPLPPFVFTLPLDPVRHLSTTPSDEQMNLPWLEDLFHLPRDSGRNRTHCLLSDGGVEFSVSLPAVSQETEIVVRRLPAPARSSPFFSGVSILPDGHLALHVDPTRLRAIGDSKSAHEDGHRGSSPIRILVVDDSPLARSLFEGILRGNGYEVATAEGGYEALEYLRARACDLVVTDIDMPDMDGWTLITALHQDPTLATLPIIVVTAKEDPAVEHRCRDLGVLACLRKGAFEQGNLMDTISRHWTRSTT